MYSLKNFLTNTNNCELNSLTFNLHSVFINVCLFNDSFHARRLDRNKAHFLERRHPEGKFIKISFQF
jgi:hypothetical protein